MQPVQAGLLQGLVGPDGSLAIQSGSTNLTGSFADERFTGVLTVAARNTDCSFELQSYSRR